MENRIIWAGLGFPLVLVGFATKRIGGEEFPDLNMRDIQEKAFRLLVTKNSRITGNELKFVRSYLQLTQQELARAINAADRSSVSQWEQKKDACTDMDLNTEIMVRLFMAKQCEHGCIQQGVQDFVWYKMKDMIFDFVSQINEENKYISISA